MDRFEGQTIWIVKVDGRIPDHWDLSPSGLDELERSASDVSLSGFPGGASLGIEGDRFEFQQVVAVEPADESERNRSADSAVGAMCERLGVLAVDIDWMVVEVPPPSQSADAATGPERRAPWFRRFWRRG